MIYVISFLSASDNLYSSPSPLLLSLCSWGTWWGREVHIHVLSYPEVSTKCLCLSLCYFLLHGLLLNLEVTDLARMALKISLFLPPQF